MASYGQIGSDLKALNLTSWIATSYFLTLTSFQPLYGKLSDIFGRKACLLSAYAIFGTGCLFCGLARNINELIAARVSVEINSLNPTVDDDSGPAGSPALENYLQDPRVKIQYITDLTFV